MSRGFLLEVSMAKRYKSGLIGLDMKSRPFPHPRRNRWRRKTKWVPLLFLAGTLGLVLMIGWR